jgi:hypothetical protein
VPTNAGIGKTTSSKNKARRAAGLRFHRS